MMVTKALIVRTTMILTKALTIAAATILYNISALQGYTPNSSINTRNSIKMSNTYNNSKGGSIICAGLSCLDLQLVGCTQSGSEEAIERYDEAVHCAGGSASMTGTTLALLLRSDDDTDTNEQREKVHILTKVGPDFAGNTLLEFYRRAGASTDLVLTDDTARTSMAVLPIYNNGKRGCFVNLACNDGFTSDELLNQLDIAVEDNTVTTSNRPTRAFLFGYPHLMPKMQGDSLRDMLTSARQKLSLNGSNSVLVGVDLNGVDGSDSTAAREALMPSLCEIDVLHLNEDEVMVLSQQDKQANVEEDTVSSEMLSQISSFHEQGCAVVLLSLGSKGAFVSVTPDTKRLQQLSNNEQQPIAISKWIPGTQVRIPAFQIDGEVNANGAGDALFSGFCLAASSWGSTMEQLVYKESSSMSSSDEEKWKVSPQVAGTFASLVAWQRCNAKTRDGNGMKSATQLMQLIHEGKFPDTLEG